MKILLDTNICSYMMKNKPPGIKKRLSYYAAGDVGISAITLSELYFGVEKSQFNRVNREAIEQFISQLKIVEFDHRAAQCYGAIRAYLTSKGTPIGPLDMLIAAHAVALKVPLVTNNVREFSRVPDLECLNWV